MILFGDEIQRKKVMAMTQIATKLAGLAVAGSFILVSGVAFAHDHPGQEDHGPKTHQVIRGVFETGSLTGPSITVKTTSGKTVTIDLTPTTRVSLEAQGTVAGIMTALNHHQLALTAQVVSKNNAWVAVGIEAHLNVQGKDQGSHHQDSSHDNAKSGNHHDN